MQIMAFCCIAVLPCYSTAVGSWRCFAVVFTPGGTENGVLLFCCPAAVGSYWVGDLLYHWNLLTAAASQSVLL